MDRLVARRSPLCAVALGLGLVVALCGCSAIATQLGAETPALPTATPEAPAAPEPSATPPAPTPTPAVAAIPMPPTEWPSPTVPVPSPTMDVSALGLVYARGTSVLQTGYLGGETREVAVVPPHDTWAFAAGRLALALGPAVEVIDLVHGTHSSLRIEADAEIEYADVYWGGSGETLLHVAVVADSAAPTFGRRVELRALAADDGRELGRVVWPDLAGVSILRYDEAAGTVICIPRGGDPFFVEVGAVDVRTGAVLASHAVQGEGDVALSPDGRLLLASSSVGGLMRLVVHDLGSSTAQEGPAMQAMRPVWSPDGRQVAYLTWAGADSTHLDLYVLDLVTMEGRAVLSGLGSLSSLAGWTPGGSHVVGHHRGEIEPDDAYVLAVRPDGGDRRILNLGADARVLGWMPPAEGATALAVDPWPGRFAQAQQDADALAAVAAEYVAAHADRDDETLSAALAERLADAGWQPDLAGPQVRRIDEGLYAAQLPPLQICLLEGGRARRVASGHLVIDARHDGDVLGLIYGVIGAGAVQPGYVLLGREADGTWTPRWSPQGQRDWVATDGEIRFHGEGLDTLHVEGTSFGIDLGEADPLVECHACPHRRLVATWTREGQAYARQTSLDANAPLVHVIWEMTEADPYAVLHEALRRARAGEAVDGLATAEALAQLEALGLLAPGVRLIAEDVQAEMATLSGVVRFSGEGGARYRATVRDGRLVDVTTDNR